MASVAPYINFADKGHEAVEFYKGVFGGEAEITLVKNSGSAGQMPAEWGERIMHLDFRAGDIRFLGSDIISDQAGKVPGNMMSIAVACDNAEQLSEYYKKLVAGGTEVWKPADSEWDSVFAQCVDRFDVQWMLNFDKSSGV